MVAPAVPQYIVNCDVAPATPEIPEFVALAVSLGVPFAPAERLWARIVVTLAEMDAGRITDEQAAARIDRLAGLVFMAARGGAQ
jgi:hypothetical protein